MILSVWFFIKYSKSARVKIALKAIISDFLLMPMFHPNGF